jgi:GTPase SAR1 family protein
MYDVTRQESFDNIPRTIEAIKKDTQSTTDAFPLPAIIVGNKIDLIHQRQVSKEKGMALANEHNLTYMEMFLADGTNAQEIWTVIIRKVLDSRQKVSPQKKNRSKCSLI